MLQQADARYARNPDFIFRRIVDELVLVPVRQDVADMDCIYTMNPVAALIWERVAEPATLAELQDAVCDVFDAAPEIVAADLIEFIGQLEQAGAVRRV